ncbi:MAG: ribosome biogenesis GTPase Der [Patescibacteria group bacterium]
MALPAVLLLGRTNVGKSSLFNRLTDGRLAIADPTPHTTRDLQRQTVTWAGREFTLVDSGGFDIEKPDELHAAVLRQVQTAMKTAFMIVLVTEASAGLRQEERRLLHQLLKDKKHVVVAVNKTDTPSDRRSGSATTPFQRGGVDVVAVSAKNGGGTGDLLDAIAKQLPQPVLQKNRGRGIKVVLIGRTNVGKSAITNTLLHDEVRVVSSQPHTTRDAAAFDLVYKGTAITLVDTAGVRTHGRTNNRIEAMSLYATRSALEHADVAALVWSMPDGIGLVEKTLAGDIGERGTGMILVANQWDRIPDKVPTSPLRAEKYIRRSLPYVAWAPMVFTSATEKHNVRRILDLAVAIDRERRRTIPQAELTALLRNAAIRLRPAAGKKQVIATELRQIKTSPPTFELATSKREALPKAYGLAVAKLLRTAYDFGGTPIIVRVSQPFAKSI